MSMDKPEPVDHIFDFEGMTNEPNHCMHVAAFYWAQAAFYDELDAEAVRVGHETMGIKFSTSACYLRWGAREAEAAANGEPSLFNERENDIEQILDGIDIYDHRKRLGDDFVNYIIRCRHILRKQAQQ